MTRAVLTREGAKFINRLVFQPKVREGHGLQIVAETTIKGIAYYDVILDGSGADFTVTSAHVHPEENRGQEPPSETRTVR